MGTPHKWAEVIKAWADGKEIQYRIAGQNDPWSTLVRAPYFGSDGIEWRIKPDTIQYRLYLWRPAGRSAARTFVGCHNENNIPTSHLEKIPEFVRWLGDWQEVDA